ncbi:unnamed protein product [Pleuronectes platessa]|uniref:Uncharacterized protein n=1 Tax=Pleuronectes platessa TaxID=8262 RepID=A0A9N7VVE3_PLEPL|nr:unnamed protein product [Pleuronectes platessa]
MHIQQRRITKPMLIDEETVSLQDHYFDSGTNIVHDPAADQSGWGGGGRKQVKDKKRQRSFEMRVGLRRRWEVAAGSCGDSRPVKPTNVEVMPPVGRGQIGSLHGWSYGRTQTELNALCIIEQHYQPLPTHHSRWSRGLDDFEHQMLMFPQSRYRDGADP